MRKLVTGIALIALVGLAMPLAVPGTASAQMRQVTDQDSRARLNPDFACAMMRTLLQRRAGSPDHGGFSQSEDSRSRSPAQPGS